MFLLVGLTDEMDVLKDVVHELFAGSLSVFGVLSDGNGNLLTGSLFVQYFSSLLSIGFILSLLLLLPQLVIGIQFLHQFSILQWVLLVLDVDHFILLGSSHNTLYFIRVDDSSQVSIAHHCSVQLVSLLVEALFSTVSEQFVKSSEGTLSPDDESSELTTRCQLQKVHSVDIAEIDSRYVSEGLQHFDIVIRVDDERSSSLHKSSVSQFSFTGSQLLALDDSNNIIVDVESLKESNSILSLFDVLHSVFNDQRQFRDLLDFVSSSQDQRSDSGSSNSSSSGMSSLFDIHSSVPSSVSLQRSEHSSLSNHVSESSLSTSASTRSTYSWNSGDGSTSSP